MPSIRIALAIIPLALSGFPLSAQPVPVANPGFEEGSGPAPAGWTLSGGNGAWLDGAASGGTRAAAVTGAGRSGDSNLWLSAPVPFEPSRTYRLSFRARSIGAEGGTAIIGPGFANLDLGPLTPEWKTYSFIFFTPDRIDPEASRIRLGQWEVKGTLAYDDVRVTPVEAVDTGEIHLGDGEAYEEGEYRFEAPLDSGFDRSRPLVRHRCRFHSNRWWLDAASEVVYRHGAGRSLQQRASVEVNVNWHSGGEAVVEASADGKDWKPLGTIGKVARGRFDIPAGLLPAREVWVRLSARAAGAGGCSLQIDGYGYRAKVVPDGDHAHLPFRAKGATRFFEIEAKDPVLEVSIGRVGDGIPGGKNIVGASVVNRHEDEAIDVAYRARVEGTRTVEGKPGLARIGDPAWLEFPYEIPDAGAWTLRIEIGRYRAAMALEVPELHRTSYGALLPGSGEAAALWTCSSGWKVSRSRPVPAARAEAVTVALAAGEAEAAQVVVRPERGLKGFTAHATDLAGPGGAALPASRIDLLRVAYVDVTRSTDGSGCAGVWPDPLPSLRDPFDLAAGENQPLWIRVTVPEGQRAGAYEGRIELASAEGWKASVPLRVTVHGFDLPRRSTCTSAFGFSPGEVFRYHRVEDPARRRELLEKYWDSFAAHRISPYDPAPLDGFGTRWPSREEIAAGKYAPAFDWSRWDAAMARALDVRGFTTFQLPVPGMGGGTFHSRVEPELLGFGEGTKEYRGLFDAWSKGVEAHLREKGWLDRSFVYWFDEPDPKDYAFVSNGFRKLRDAAPGIPRMLTEQPEEALFGGPTIWCAITPEYRHEAAEKRRAHGEKFWWYVCTGPKAPWCTLFLDHPATEMRVWLWQTWQRKIEGILVWQTNYWSSPCAYPDPAEPQDPWRDPMSWVSGYSTPDGVRSPWGNGDGRFIYPPPGATGRQRGEVLDGPVDSIRWEMLRDGVEDYEYLAILKGLLAEKGAALPGGERETLAKLLEVPETITKDMTAFTRDPAPIEARREEIARAIERLRGLPGAGGSR